MLRETAGSAVRSNYLRKGSQKRRFCVTTEKPRLDTAALGIPLEPLAKKFSKKIHVEIFKANLRLSSAAKQSNRLRLRTRVRALGSVIKMFTDGTRRRRSIVRRWLRPSEFLAFRHFLPHRGDIIPAAAAAKCNLRFPISQVTACSLESPFKWHFFLQFTWTVVITS